MRQVTQELQLLIVLTLLCLWLQHFLTKKKFPRLLFFPLMYLLLAELVKKVNSYFNNILCSTRKYYIEVLIV